MRRIVVRPDGLSKLARDCDATARDLRVLSERLGGAMSSLDWETRKRMSAEARVQEVLQRAAALSSKAEELSRYLARKAGAFTQADEAGIGGLEAAGGTLVEGQSPLAQGAALSEFFRTRVGAFLPLAAASSPAAIPLGATAGLTWLVKQRPDLFGVKEDQGGVGVVAPVQPAPIQPIAPAKVDVQKHLDRFFPRSEDQLILRHTMGEEGLSQFDMSHGGVVYRNETGLLSDRQWINFGLISFAYPSGSGGDVLRAILQQPGEEEALREILLKHLQDNPGGEVEAGWSHLLNNRADKGIPSMTADEMADEFIARIKAGEDKSHQDWMFKYVNTPETRSGIANGRMREDWKAALSEFLARPASQEAQMVGMQGYYEEAVDKVRTDFGLTSVRGVAFIFDTTVQHGGPTDLMKQEAATAAYKAASESEKLQKLLGCFTEGTTTYNRRRAVMESQSLTDALYNP